MNYALLLLLLCFSQWSLAYTQDNAITAAIESKVKLALSFDFMNEDFAFFQKQDRDIESDYKAYGFSLGFSPYKRLWFEGSYTIKSLDISTTHADVDSWYVAAQYQIFQNGDGVDFALRISDWRDQSDKVQRNYNMLSGVTSTSQVSIKKPFDEQQQLDLIINLPLEDNSALLLTGLLSYGLSKVGFSDYSVQGKQNGCLYDIRFQADGYTGKLAQPSCTGSGGVTLLDFFSPYSKQDIQIENELKYRATYFQAGLALRGTYQQWSILASYRYTQQNRKKVDSIIRSRGLRAYTTNHIAHVAVAYAFIPQLSIQLAATVYKNQLNGELPFLYNSATAKHFGKRYGLLTSSIVLRF